MATSKKSVIEQLANLPPINEAIARSMYDELGLRTLEDVIDAASDGKLQAITGVGKKKEAAILEAAKSARKANGSTKKSARGAAKNGVQSDDPADLINHECAKAALAELGKDRVLELYRDMLLLRRFEEQAGRQYQMGKIKGFCHLYIGQEAVAVGSIAAVRDDDYIVTAYREHGHALARGIAPNSVMAELFGKKTGASKGKGGSMHIFDVERHFYGGWGIVGGHIPTAAGMAFAAKYRGEDRVALCYLGDGSIHQGVVHETMNMAVLWDLPLVLIIENNHYAMGTALERASAVKDLSQKGISHGVEGESVDGQDLFAVWEAVRRAAKEAREEGKTKLLDVITYRYRGHSMSDPAKYRTKEEVDQKQKIGPVVRLHAWLVREGIATDEELQAMDEDVKAEVKASVKFAEESDFPDPSALLEDVYVEWNWDIE